MQVAIDSNCKGKIDTTEIIASLACDKNGNIIEKIIIGHSMGGAYTKGYAEAILNYAEAHGIEGVKISFEADFAPFQPDKQSVVNRKNIGQHFNFHIKMIKLQEIMTYLERTKWILKRM